ncbi:MAG: glycosyltransferase [Desulfovibrio sp.]|nr:glycosyltransferase [Desulfovibrio sp.]
MISPFFSIITAIRNRGATLPRLPNGITMPHTALFHRRSLFTDKAFSTDFKIGGDYDFLCRTLAPDNHVYSDLVVSCMSIGGASASLPSMLRCELEHLAISRRYFPRALRLTLYARICRGLLSRAILSVFGQKTTQTFADLSRVIWGKSPLRNRKDFALPLPVLPERPRVSLLVATLGRAAPLEKLFASLNRQTYGNFEVLVADQNAPGFLDASMNCLDSSIPVRRVSLPAQGVSKARNALLPLAGGDIIAFPDDDCCYRPETLQYVIDLFTRFPHLGGIIVGWSEAWPSDAPAPPATDISLATLENAFMVAGMLTQFYRREVAEQVLFDPKLGPGTGLPYGCGEDTDYLLQVLKKGWLVGRSPEALVCHSKPDFSDPAMLSKTRAYALGRMHLLRKHKFSLWFKLANIFYPLCRMPFESPRTWPYRRTMFLGRIKGFLSVYKS